MADNMDNMESDKNGEALRSRRAVLKMIAGAPLLFSFGLATSPLMRYLKPTMKPLDYFQAADLPAADPPALFNWRDFPEIWTCLPFMLPMKYLVFNPEQYEIRKIPGFAIRIDNNELVAFSRICPVNRNHVLNYEDVRPTANGSCGCADNTCKGDCIGHAKNSFLICPCDRSIFDVGNNGRVLRGPAPYPARQFTVSRNGDLISISGISEQYGIA